MVSGKCNLVSQSYILSSQWEGLQSLSQDVLTTCQGCKSLCLIKHHARIDWHPSSCLAEMGNYPFLPMRMDRYEYDRMYLLQKPSCSVRIQPIHRQFEEQGSLEPVCASTQGHAP
ncbi:uncharacterized protein LOC120300205 isoform X6 [Crotalus tigris]|uniref:uncharacterized protein LOC120300205 isoform X6 n=1 Tax=Crotalus tigris TaxID=88082 RepID=UPI00192F1799|nr:uncharacterized protein LOC120300205 isoform X6 [Crotalus tigris]